MKILVLNYEYPPVGGGGGRLAEMMCAAFVVRGHAVRVVTAGVGNLPRTETRDGVEILRPRSFRKRRDTCTVPEMGLYLATALPAALALARTWKPDVVHAHFVVPTGLLALSLRRLAGVPYVITAHLGDVPGGVPEQTGGLFRLALGPARAVWRNASARTAVSNHVGTLAADAFGSLPEIIPNGIPPLPPPPPRASPPATPKILMAGRLSVQKNPLLAIEALAKLRDLPWTFEVVGEGPLAARMQAAAAGFGLSERVVFSGWLCGEEVAARMRAADILLLTSLHEGLPMVAVEALWHGMAIVATRIGGMTDLVDHDANGLLCNPNPEEVADALASLIQNPGRLASMQNKSLENARRFDFNAATDAYLRVLEAAAD